MRTAARTGLLVTLVAAALLVAVSGRADDRDLLRADGAPPNVLLILDSGGSMTHDAYSNQILFPANGDDNGQWLDFIVQHYGDAALTGMLGPDYPNRLAEGSKLAVAKRALMGFLDAGFGFNLGFSFYEKTDIVVHYLNFIYTPKAYVLDEDGVLVAQQPMLDGTVAGWPVRMGSQYDANHNENNPAPPAYPIRYGLNGDETFVLYETGGVWTTDVPPSPRNGDRRIVSYLIDAAGNRKVAGSPPFYYPAYDWSGLSTGRLVQDALQGWVGWDEVAAAAGIDMTQPRWKETVRDYALEDIKFQGDPWGGALGALSTSNQIGSRELSVHEELQTYRNDTRVWQTTDERTTVLEYVQHFVLYDHEPGEPGTGQDTLAASEYQGQADCQGYLDDGDLDRKAPIVPLSQPDSSDGSISDQKWQIEPFFESQAAPVFYFPNAPVEQKFLPDTRASWIPLTESVIATGRRPIKDTINEAKFYFEQVVRNWDDPLRNCRMDFVVIITDGVETCSNTTAPCSAADNIGKSGIPVYVIYFGTEDNVEDTDQTVLSCVAKNSGGRYYAAGSERELNDALRNIALDIEERTRGFTAPIVPSVETTTRQTAFLSTFTPKEARSIWRGHVRAYPIDPLTGGIKGLRVDGTPDPSVASWDAGDALAARSADGRVMYVGVEPSGTAMPGSRAPFAYAGGETIEDATARELLGNRIFYPGTDLWADTDQERAQLLEVLNFIRGVRLERDSSGVVTVPGRDADVYGWCGDTSDESELNPLPVCDDSNAVNVEKLGDTFHAVPQLVARPRCYPCWLQNLHGYRDDPDTGTPDDGFIGRYAYRRQVLYVGADDGALHALDAGLWDPDGDPLAIPAKPAQYDVGTGRELFAFVPESVMPILDDLATSSNHRWTVDGTPSVADVWIDRQFDSVPDTQGREWRTLVLFGQRRGARSVVALDVTQPDRDSDGDGVADSPAVGDISESAVLDASSADRDATCVQGGDGCSGSWPEFRWELTDTSDEDGNGAPDLGQTWSRPLVGFVRVLTPGGDLQERTVAFFGGGYSPDGLHPNRLTGNFIYGVDVERGTILFKQQVTGMVPGDVSALDIDLDGFLERLYWGDTSGRLYRMDIDQPGQIGALTGRVGPTTVDGKVYWQARAFFVASSNQPFFLRPTIVPIEIGSDGTPTIALAIGSGNRDNILEKNAVPNRFYVVVDRPKLDGDGNPVVITEPDLSIVYPTSEASGISALSGYGWALVLDQDGDLSTESWEKVNTPALVLNQYVVFSTFTPSSTVDEVPIYNDDGEIIGYACRRNGNARTYNVSLYNADPPPGAERSMRHEDGAAMATEPVVYVGADGKIHVVQALDNLKLVEPVGATLVPVRVNSWKEE